MEEANRLTVRDRRPEPPLAVIPTPSATGTAWDQLPRQPHLLDYLIILRKHQWLVVTFLLTCSAAAETTLAWVAVSSAFEPID